MGGVDALRSNSNYANRGQLVRTSIEAHHGYVPHDLADP